MLKRSLRKLAKWTWGTFTGTYALFLLFGNYSITIDNYVLPPHIAQQAEVSVYGYPKEKEYVIPTEQDAQVLRDWVSTLRRIERRQNDFVRFSGCMFYAPQTIRLQIGGQVYYVGEGGLQATQMLSHGNYWYTTWSEDYELSRQVDNIIDKYSMRRDYNRYILYDDPDMTFRFKLSREWATRVAVKESGEHDIPQTVAVVESTREDVGRLAAIERWPIEQLPEVSFERQDGESVVLGQKNGQAYVLIFPKEGTPPKEEGTDLLMWNYYLKMLNGGHYVFAFLD